jgi:PhnB protein
MNIQPYLYFGGRSQEAIDFYKSAVGAKVEVMMHFKDAPAEMQTQIKPGTQDKVMHACIKVGDTPVFVSDGDCGGKPEFKGVTLTINADNDAEAEKLFGALGKGGQVQMPMTETFFATRFGMLADKFGVSWMVLAAKKLN